MRQQNRNLVKNDFLKILYKTIFYNEVWDNVFIKKIFKNETIYVAWLNNILCHFAFSWDNCGSGYPSCLLCVTLCKTEAHFHAPMPADFRD